MDFNESDLDSDSDSEFFTDHEAVNGEDAPVTIESLLPQILAQLEEVKLEVKQQADVTYDTLEAINAEVLAQSTVVTQLHQRTKEQQDQLNRILQRTKDVPDQLEALSEPIQRLQALQPSRSGRERRQRSKPAPPPISPRTIGLVLVAQAVLVASVTALTLHVLPPGTNIKSQQQWYAIFQRIDRMYKDQYGSKN